MRWKYKQQCISQVRNKETVREEIQSRISLFHNIRKCQQYFFSMLVIELFSKEAHKYETGEIPGLAPAATKVLKTHKKEEIVEICSCQFNKLQTLFHD